METNQEFRHVLEIIPYPLLKTLSEFCKYPTIHVFKNMLKIGLYYSVMVVFGKHRTESLGVSCIQYKTQGAELCIPIDSFFEICDIYDQSVFDHCYNPKADDTVIDVGAHVGIFTVKIAQKVKSGCVVAIEPDKVNYKHLVNNIEKNGLKNVVTVNAALSSICGRIRLFLNDSSVAHSIVNESKRSVEVRSFTLDDLVRRLGLHRVDFVKINAEGAELDILKGAERTLQENNVSLSIAADHYHTQVRDVSSVLSDLGFKTRTYKRFVYASRDGSCKK